MEIPWGKTVAAGGMRRGIAGMVYGGSLPLETTANVEVFQYFNK